MGATIRSAAIALWRPFAPRARVALIVGHMRCGSTLLLHLLADGSDRLTCGERNTPYATIADFDRLEAAARFEHRRPFGRVTYVVDQVNHDKFTPNPELLTDDRVRCVMLIRPPTPTIASLLRLTATFYTAWTIERAIDYYVNRLATLTALTRTLPGRQWILVTYDDIVHHTQPTFTRLESFLDLPNALNHTYALQSFTGRRGDPTSTIRSGRIVRSAPDTPVDLPAGALSRATEAFEALLRHA